jgi:hypothetical protein
VNTNSTTPRGCDGCSRDLGYTMNLLTITHRGRRYEVCGRSCLDRLMEHLSQASTTSTSATNATTIAAHYRKIS